jgi:glycosyltransferase involved in cell wall biosynthesis
MDNHTPFLTIVMPVRNEERFISETIRQLTVQDYPKDRFEIIIADGESSDKTREIVARLQVEYQNIKLITNPGRLPSSGRNLGFKHGLGEYFLVVDGHCQIPDKLLLKSVVEAFQKSGADCLGRSQPFVVPEEDNWQRAIALARASSLGHSTNSYIHAAEEAFVSPVSMGCAYSRRVFDKIGYVDESFDACEDVEFNYRVEKAGFKTFFTPKIAVIYFPRETLGGFWKQLIRYGKGRTRFVFKHPETINLDMLIPVIFSAGIITGPFLGLIYRPFLFLYLITLVVYISIVLYMTVRISARDNFVSGWKLVLVFITIHFSLGFGEMIQVVKLLFQRKK